MRTLYKTISIEKLKKVYLELVKMQLQIDHNGGPEENGALFEEYLMLREKMLKRFGLPDKEGFAKILYVDNQPTELEIDDRVKVLHGVAADYLLSAAKSECQILKEAQDNRESPFEVLPELGIATHSYTIFIYIHILLSKRDTVENILAELKKANNSKTLNALGKFEQGNVKKPEQLIKKLKQEEIKYIDDFIKTFPKNE
jgi:hypothetical protein